MFVFGMQFSDGSECGDGLGPAEEDPYGDGFGGGPMNNMYGRTCDKVFTDVDKIKRIEVRFNNAGVFLQTIKFFDAKEVELLTIGGKDIDETSRVETFSIEEDEELCGCYLHHEATGDICGVTWIKRVIALPVSSGTRASWLFGCCMSKQK